MRSSPLMMRLALSVCLGVSVAVTPAEAQYRALHYNAATGQIQTYQPTELSLPQTSTLRLIAASDVGTVTHSEVVSDPAGVVSYMSRGSSIAVVDQMTGGVTSWTSVDTPGPLAISADGLQLFVGRRGATIVAVVDTATGLVAQSIVLAEEAHDLALSPDGRWLVAAHKLDPTDNFVSVVDMQTTTVTLHAVGELEDVAVAPDGSVVYLATTTAVLIHDRATWSVLDTVDVPGQRVTSELALSPDGTTLLVGFGDTAALTTASDLYHYNTVTNDLTVTLARGWGRVTWSLDGLRAAAVLHNEAADVPGQQYTVWVLRNGTWREFPLFASPNPFSVITTVTPACAAFVQNPDRSVPLAGGTISLPFTIPNGCPATATTTTPWLSLGPVIETGPLSRSVQATATAGFARTGYVRVPGRDITIRQEWAQVVVDSPANGASAVQPVAMSGWAFVADGVSANHGVNSVAIWAYPRSGGSPVGFTATLNLPRPDIEAVYGIVNAGWHATLSGLATGTWDLVTYVQSKYSGLYTPSAVREITVQSDAPDVVMQIDSIAPGGWLPQPLVISGWALDRTAPSGSGVDNVQVWAFPVGGGSPHFIGSAALGLARADNDILNAYGQVVSHPGFAIVADGLPEGAYYIAAYAHAPRVHVPFWSAQDVVQVTLQGTAEPGAIWVRTPPSPQFSLQGYALDRGAVSGPGVATVHVWAYPLAGSPVFLGAATPGVDASTDRPELVPLFGAEKAASGWRLTGLSLPPGTYTVVAFGYSTVTGSFSNVRVTTVTIPGT